MTAEGGSAGTVAAEVVSAVAGLAEVLDAGRLHEVCWWLCRVDEAIAGDWSVPSVVAVRERVVGLDPRARAEVVGSCVGGILMVWRPGLETDKAQRERVMLTRLASMVSQGYPNGATREFHEDWLHLVGRQWGLMELERTEELLRAELAAGRPLDGAVIAALRRTVFAIRPHHHPVIEFAAQFAEPLLSPGEAWADQALGDLAADTDGSWAELVRHAFEAKSAKPTARWEKTGLALLDAVGPDQARERITGWLALVGRPRTLDLVAEPSEDGLLQFDPYNLDALRGLALLLGLLPAHPESARVLGRLVVSALRKAPGLGPRAPKVANAAVYALARLDGTAGLAQLALLSSRVRYKGTLKELEKALQARAAALGVGPEELEELAVPDYGLTEVGACVREFGAARVELLVEGLRVRQGWQNEAGRAVKAVPASVRREHAVELKEFKEAVGDIERMLAACAERLERAYLARRGWRYAAWRERYLDHPLVGTLARRLIWTVGGVDCRWSEGALRTADGTELAPADGDSVELWHPVGAAETAVAGWREALAREQIEQPFPQAHRHVFQVAAEDVAGCDRFAGRVLSQRRFRAVAEGRGWQSPLQLLVDNSFGAPRRALPAWGLRAEYWVIGTDADWGEPFERLTTGEVRFYPLDAPENLSQAPGGAYGPIHRPGLTLVDPVPPAEVPPLVLSEILRDVSLFVSRAESD